jgi:hypothetical protein
MADYSLFDVIGGRPERFDVYDQPNVGPTPVLQQAPAQADQSWTQMLGQMAKRYMDNQGAATPSGSLQSARPSGSSQGLLSNSRSGVDIGTVIKIASAIYGAPAAAPAAGAMGGGAGMAPGMAVAADAAPAAASGGGSMMGGMGSMFGGGGGGASGGGMDMGGMLSGIMGGGGVSSKGGSRGGGGLSPVLGGYQGKAIPRSAFADVPMNRNPLIPQGVNSFDIRNYPQPY